MKSKLDSNTSATQKYKQFQGGLQHVLTVSKDELAKRETEYQAERATQKKRGPRPHSSASGRASNDGD